MKKRLFLPLLIIFSIIVTPLTVYAEELEQPTLPPNQTEESVAEYNQQVDEYNNTIDEIYEKELEEYNKEKEAVDEYNEQEDLKAQEVEDFNKQEEERVAEENQKLEEEYNSKVQEATKHNEQEDLKVEENQKQIEAYEKSQEEIEKFSERGITENRTTDIEEIPTTFEVTNEKDNCKTIKVVETSDDNSKETYAVMNLHLFLGEGNNDDTFCGTDVKDESFQVNEDILNNVVLAEWECTEVKEDDIVTVISVSESMGYRSAAFYKKIEGYTNGYWSPGVQEFASTCAYSYSIWYKGSAQEFSYIDGATDRNGIKNVFNVFLYNFYRTGEEPEKVEEYTPDYWEVEEVEYIEGNFKETYIPQYKEYPDKPVKKDYLEKITYTKEEQIETEIETEPETMPSSEPEIVIPVSVPEVRPSQPNISTSNSNNRRLLLATPSVKMDEKVQKEIQENIAKQESEEVIEDNTTPLSVMSGHWALINLIITILSIIFTIILVIFCIREKTDKDKPKEERKITKRCIFSKIINVLFSIILIVLFILTQDMSLPMELTDEFTIITLIIFILQLIVFVAIETIGEKKEERVDE